MDISVVIPLYNEAESLPELFSWIERVMKEHNYTYEVIFVNDGSTDNSWEVIEELKQRSPHVRGIKFRRNYGKSPGLHCGFQRAKGDVVITMDADLQDSPDEIPELYRMITEDGYDLVSGWKKKMMTQDNRKKLIEQYTNLEHLDRFTVEKLIDYIDIGKRNTETKELPIEIHWNF